MKKGKINYLDQSIKNLKGMMTNFQTINTKVDLDGKLSIELDTKFFVDHFFVRIGNCTIQCIKGSECNIYEIQEGLYKGCYALIEESFVSNKETTIYILHQNGIFKLASIDKNLSKENIERFLQEDYSIDLITKVFCVTKLDARRPAEQPYGLFCEKLPTGLRENKEFWAKIKEKLEDDKQEVSFTPVISKKYAELLSQTAKEDAINYICDIFNIQKNKEEENE